MRPAPVPHPPSPRQQREPQSPPESHRPRTTSPRNRILEAFEDRARKVGIRGVVMSELARELGISKKTLYQHFSSKEDLVSTMIDHMMSEMHQRGDEISSETTCPKALARRWAQVMLRGEESYTKVFWQELERDYPEAYTAMQEQTELARLRAMTQLAAHLRDDVSPELAIATFGFVLTGALDPDLCERLRMTREESVMSALAIWARGALRTHPGPTPGARRLRRIEDRTQPLEA